MVRLSFFLLLIILVNSLTVILSPTAYSSEDDVSLEIQKSNFSFPEAYYETSFSDILSQTSLSINSLSGISRTKISSLSDLNLCSAPLIPINEDLNDKSSYITQKELSSKSNAQSITSNSNYIKSSACSSQSTNPVSEGTLVSAEPSNSLGSSISPVSIINNYLEPMFPQEPALRAPIKQKTTSQSVNQRYSETKVQDPIHLPPSSHYTPHEAIYINGNEDFLTQAAAESWNGTGDTFNPIIISDYNITFLPTMSSRSLIDIRNTNLYFQISNNFLKGKVGSHKGISLENVDNGIVSNNFIFNNEIGIKLLSSSSNTLLNNTIANNYQGLLIESADNDIYTNLLYNNTFSGISLWGASGNILISNFLFFNQFGLNLYDSSSIIVSSNTIYNNYRGIHIQASVSDTQIMWNDFIGNSPNILNSQAYDDGFNNTFMYNYWADWINPDANDDNIVDHPYPIDGAASNSDFSPKKTPSNSYSPKTPDFPRILHNSVFGFLYNLFIIIVFVLFIGIAIFITLKTLEKNRVIKNWVNKIFTTYEQHLSRVPPEKCQKEILKETMIYNILTALCWYLLSAESSLLMIVVTSSSLLTRFLVTDVGLVLFFGLIQPIIHPWTVSSMFSAMVVPSSRELLVWLTTFNIIVLLIHVIAASLVLAIRIRVFQPRIDKLIAKLEVDSDEDMVVVIVSEEKVLGYAKEAQDLVKSYKEEKKL